MKIYKPKKVKDLSEFSGRVEVACSPIDTAGRRMTSKDGVARKSIRLENTTPEEVFEVITKALQKHCK